MDPLKADPLKAAVRATVVATPICIITGWIFGLILPGLPGVITSFAVSAGIGYLCVWWFVSHARAAAARQWTEDQL